MGESNNNFNFLNVNKDLINKIEYFEILRNRNCRQEISHMHNSALYPT